MLVENSRTGILATLLVLAVLVPGERSMATEIEEPVYRLVEKLGPVEIRRYEPAVQAVTRLRHSGKTSSGFQRLANYIFGGNMSAESIAMTAPVQETLGTASPEMAFTMPAAYALGDLPQPRDSKVELRELPGRYVASIGFGGWATAGKVESAQRRLAATLAEYGVEPEGPSSLNQFNPPWTLPFLRRNEINVNVSWPDSEQTVVLAR